MNGSLAHPRGRESRGRWGRETRAERKWEIRAERSSPREGVARPGDVAADAEKDSRARNLSILVCALSLLVPLSPLASAAEEPLYEEPPFDRITLNEANDHAVLRVKPLKLPPEEATRKRRRGEKLVVELMDNPGTQYEVDWQAIEKIESFDEVVLAKARELADEKKFDEAYDYLVYLERNRPKTPGLNEGIEDFLLEEAKWHYEANRYDASLAMLRELCRRNRQRPGLDRALAATTERLVEQYAASNRVALARRLIRNLAAVFPQHPAVAKWEDQWRQQATALAAEARAALGAGQLRKADETIRRVLDIWPTLDGLKELLAEVQEKYPRVVVGVMAPAKVFEPGRLNDWAARRSSRLIYRTLTEFVGPSPEGGRYLCPMGRIRVEPLDRRMVIDVKPGHHWASGEATLTGYELARRLVGMTDVQDWWYRPDWAEIFQSVSVQDVYRVTVELRRPHVRPEALLQTIVVPVASAALQPPLTNGPYVIVSQTDAETRYEASPQYADSRPGQPKEIVERYFRKGSEAIAALRRREIDVVDRINPWEWEAVRSDEDLVVAPYAVPLVHCLVPNKRRPITADRTFCRALVYAIRREAILKQIIGIREALGEGAADRPRGAADRPQGVVVSGPFSPGVGYNDPLDYAYDRTIEPRPYEPRLAVILAEVGLRQAAAANPGKLPQFYAKTKDAGAAGRVSNSPDASSPPSKPAEAKEAPPAAGAGPAKETPKNVRRQLKGMPRLVLAYPPRELAEVACKSIKSQLEAVGIPMVLEELPHSLPGRIPDHVDLMYAELAMWEPVVDARRLLGEDGLSGGCTSYMSLALGQLEQATEWLKVGARLRDIHRIAHDDVAVVPLWQITEHFAYHRSLAGIGPRPVTLYQNVEQWQPSLLTPPEVP